MRIAVISDTHDIIRSGLPEKIQGADEIWHLGDVMAYYNLAVFEKLGPPLKVVRGNCDAYPFWPGSLSLEREGVNCHLVHIPPSQVPSGVHLLLHGHTHVPRDETDPLGVRWLNPGSASQPRGGLRPSFAWLQLSQGRVERWDIVEV